MKTNTKKKPVKKITKKANKKLSKKDNDKLLGELSTLVADMSDNRDKQAFDKLLTIQQQKTEEIGMPWGQLTESNETDVIGQIKQFAKEMAVYALIEKEEMIVNLEHFLVYNPPNKTTNQIRIDGYKKDHAEMHKKLTKQFGKEFKQIYTRMLKDANESSRQNLDHSDGKMYCYVIPKFNPDGSHAPVGPKDAPWNVYKK